MTDTRTQRILVLTDHADPTAELKEASGTAPRPATYSSG